MACRENGKEEEGGLRRNGFTARRKFRIGKQIRRTIKNEEKKSKVL